MGEVNGAVGAVVLKLLSLIWGFNHFALFDVLSILF